MPAPPAAPSNQVAGTASFSKFMHVLQLVADAEEPMNVGALVRASGYPRPTVHRIVAALVAEGLLADAQGGARLALGPRLIQLASRSWGGSELRLAAVEELKRLRDLTGETVHLAVPNGQAMVYIEKLESPSAVRMASRIGTTVSLHSTAVGKAYLAALERRAFQALVRGLPMPRHTANTVGDLAALSAQVEATRLRGWSVDVEENEAGIHCFGAAVCLRTRTWRARGSLIRFFAQQNNAGLVPAFFLDPMHLLRSPRPVRWPSPPPSPGGLAGTGSCREGRLLR